MRKWTKEQSDAIFSKWTDENKTISSNILVNAAAGSGKTAVLVERIINKICSDTNSPDFCDINNILVVTFTNAAAKEMKQRIYDALNQKLADAVNENDIVFSEHLKKQIKLINQADITTIDSFCLKIVKNYFHLINIDPDFRIADTFECELLKDEVIEELFDELYSDEKFIKLAFMLTDGRDTKEISDTIKRLFNFTRSLPDPDKWMEDKLAQICISNENNIYFNIVKSKINQELEYAKRQLKNALISMITISTGNDLAHSEKEFSSFLKNNPPECENDIYLSFGTYYTAIYNEYFMTSEIIGKQWDEMLENLKAIEFINLRKTAKYKDKDKIITDKEILDDLKVFRNNAKDAIKSAQSYINTKTDEIYRISKENIYPMISSLIGICRMFETKYNEKKRSKNALEFSDIEHLCLKIIREHDDVKNLFKEKYNEILIDEYQDTNGLQEEIFTSISQGNNMFMVGDMKQSIYRFRNSDPDIFKLKNDAYKKEEFSDNRKIILSKNFRSRKEVLSSVNSVFGAIMSENVGEIDYDIDQQLNLGNAEFLEKNQEFEEGYKSECCIILAKSSDDDVDENLTSVQTEARFIAKKIKELKDNNFLVCDKKTVKNVDENGNIKEEQISYYRPIENKDIAILFSSHKNVATDYQNELLSFGIDCYVEVGGYFDKNEITMIISMLKMINNPYNDLPLIAVMRSPLFGFTDDELCEIKLCGGDNFYDCLKVAMKNLQEPLKTKCSSMIKDLERWRHYKKFMPCDKLIWTLYEETGLYSFCESLYGEEAAANLRLLFVRAKNFEQSGYRGLFNFIRYIMKMQKREDKMSSATILGENSNVVRLMTIHKSKGLEFPVVFVAGCSKGFNLSDSKQKIIFHKDLGFGANYVNYESNFYDKTLQKHAVIIKSNVESVSEEMRKLYVAMTRAKEKLYITAVCNKKNTEEFSQIIPDNYMKWIKSIDNNGKFDEKDSVSAGSYINWIAPVAISDCDNWIFKTIPYSDVIKTNFECINEDMFGKDEINLSVNISQNNYIYERSTNIPTKVPVTQINNLNKTSIEDLIKKPKFMSDKSIVGGAQRGTAVHYVMQKYIPSENYSIDEICGFINSLVENEELSQAEVKSFNPSIILDFYNSEIGQRLLKSDKVFREVPFEVELPLKDIYSINAEEKIILQGVIDCFFYEDDEIVLIDYKTDNYSDINEIREKYSQQLQLYKYAIEKISKKVVKNQILYLFSTKSMIQY